MKENVQSIEMYKALGDETRFTIFLTLAQCKERMCVGAIAQKLGLSQPAVSQHLKILKAAGIATSARDGHKIHYGINREEVISSLRTTITMVGKPEYSCKELIE
jgi:DNA-binding transcriptional ArsR family regulator